MPRTASFSKKELGTKKARLKLEAHPRNIAFETIGNRLSVGYRRDPGASAGHWYVRREVGRTDTGSPMRQIQRIGEADDIRPADGVAVRDYEQARRAAGAWTWAGAKDRTDGPYTVRQAIEGYLRFRESERGADSAERARLALGKYVTGSEARGRRPGHKAHPIAERPVAELTSEEIRNWRDGMVRQDKDDPEVERKSKDTANRVLTDLCAALTWAYKNHEREVPSRGAWDRVEAFENVGKPRDVAFKEPELRRLIKAARKIDDAIANLIIAGALTGARLGDLTGARVQHFNKKDGAIEIPKGKTGRRYIVLQAEAREFFESLVKDHEPDDFLLVRSDGEPWQKSQHFRPFNEAVKAAKLNEDGCFYSLRHSYATKAIESGVAPHIIADNMGTSEAMLRRTYAKVFAQHRRHHIEAAAPRLGLNLAS